MGPGAGAGAHDDRRECLGGESERGGHRARRSWRDGAHRRLEGYRRTDYTSRYTVRRCIVRSMTKRLSLILGEADESVLEPFIRSGTGQHRVLQRWAAEHGVGNVNSEAAAIRALLQAGADALRDDVLDDGYAELAQVYDETEAGDERRAARDRYVARTDATA